MPRSLFARLATRYGPHVSKLERREFLRLALAAAAGSLVRPTRVEAVGRGRRVLVIGAGFSGLACAHELLAHGFEVLVLEARDRIGGRVFSLHDLVPQRVIEGGGELIGSNHRTWLRYAKHFQLPLRDVTEDESLSAPLILGGRRMGDREAKALWKEMEHAHSLMSDAAKPINADEPWKSPDAQRLDARNTADWIARLPISEFGKRVVTIELAANNGQATARQSLLGNLTQVKGGGLEKYWTESEVYRCGSGNASLAQKLARAIGDARLRRNSPVREIRVEPTQVAVQNFAGEKFEADEVVLALPPSVWNRIRFSPALPRALRPQMGLNVKYLAAVRKRFWLEQRLSPNAMSDDLISMTWEGTDNQGNDSLGAELTCFSGGPAAARARRSWSRRKDTDFHQLLEKAYPGFAAQFLRSRFMDWPSEEWTRAGYSFPAPGQITTLGPIMRAGLGRLHFAGEHTCYQFVGYMEGALRSGVDAANRIAAR